MGLPRPDSAHPDEASRLVPLARGDVLASEGGNFLRIPVASTESPDRRRGGVEKPRWGEQGEWGQQAPMRPLGSGDQDRLARSGRRNSGRERHFLTNDRSLRPKVPTVVGAERRSLVGGQSRAGSAIFGEAARRASHPRRTRSWPFGMARGTALAGGDVFADGDVSRQEERATPGRGFRFG